MSRLTIKASLQNRKTKTKLEGFDTAQHDNNKNYTATGMQIRQSQPLIMHPLSDKFKIQIRRKREL